jgi:hypothetical protein
MKVHYFSQEYNPKAQPNGTTRRHNPKAQHEARPEEPQQSQAFSPELEFKSKHGAARNTKTGMNGTTG